MRVLHIINSLATGGAEKLVLDSLPLYKNKGIVVDLLLFNDLDYPFLQKLKEMDCCKIYVLRKGSIYSVWNAFRIIPFFKNYDLVHVHLFPAQYFAVFAKIMSGSKTKLIFTEHNWSNRRLENFWFRLIDKHIYKFYSKVVCIAEDTQQVLLKKYNLKRDQLCVIENGVNLENIKLTIGYERKAISENLSVDDKVIIQVAAFRAQKDHKTLIKTLVLLPDHFKLILIGEGETKKDHQELVQRLKLQGRVLFLGIRMDVPELLKTADIAVLSSKYEGLSLSSIEAMASGRPFIASDVPGLRGIVKDAGILIPLGDAHKLAKEILRLASDKRYYDTIVTQCLARAEHYDISTMVDQHISLYEELLKDDQKRSILQPELEYGIDLNRNNHYPFKIENQSKIT
jgi:glycosyltransferase involved in cell wall biosynthesis